MSRKKLCELEFCLPKEISIKIKMTKEKSVAASQVSVPTQT
jgi:hypothetical protein